MPARRLGWLSGRVAVILYVTLPLWNNMTWRNFKVLSVEHDACLWLSHKKGKNNTCWARTQLNSQDCEQNDLYDLVLLMHWTPCITWKCKAISEVQISRDRHAWDVLWKLAAHAWKMCSVTKPHVLDQEEAERCKRGGLETNALALKGPPNGQMGWSDLVFTNTTFDWANSCWSWEKQRNTVQWRTQKVRASKQRGSSKGLYKLLPF